MATNPSFASTLPWFWVIETLASFKQVDASILIDLVKRTPEISNDLGENAREMVSLRILGSMFAHGIGTTDDIASPSDSKITFDPSERCEVVLRRILHETSASNLKSTGPEMLKWDVQPFVMHKRRCLPECALQQLKDAILKVSHPLLAPLKERSGLAIQNQVENGIHVDGGDSSGVAQRLEGSITNTLDMAAKGKAVSLTPENGVDLFPENLPNRNLLPAKRVGDVLAIENQGGQILENQIVVVNGCGPQPVASKKLKQDATFTRQAEGENSASLCGTQLAEDLSGRIVEHTGREECGLLQEPQVANLEESRSPDDGCGEDDESKRLGQNGNVDKAELINNQKLIPYNGDEVYEATSGEVDGQSISPDEAKEESEGCAELRTSNGAPQGVPLQKISVYDVKDKHEDSFQENASNDALPGEAKHDTERNCEPEMSSDSDGYHDEIFDIATKKQSFLSSQCTHSQDSLATTDWTELNLCMKCNKGGQLLVCSSESCPLVVHESCLGSAASFDERGNFYCPFCAYSRAISMYLEMKKNASTARKDLTAFIGLGIEHQPRFYKRLHRTEQNQARQDEDLDENTEANNSGDYLSKVNNLQCRANIEDKLQAEPLVSCDHDKSPDGGKSAAVTNETVRSLTEDKQEGEEMGQECLSPILLPEQQIPVHVVHNCEVDNSSGRGTELVQEGETHTEIGMRRGLLHQPVTDLPREPACPPSTDGEDSSEEENDKSIASNYSIRFRKREKQYTYPAIPQLRRKKLAWTKVEEETLKEGVKRFSSDNDKSIPWKKILEFGGNEFQKGRTTIDLKDKWRNICKGSPKSK